MQPLSSSEKALRSLLRHHAQDKQSNSQSRKRVHSAGLCILGTVDSAVKPLHVSVQNDSYHRTATLSLASVRLRRLQAPSLDPSHDEKEKDGAPIASACDQNRSEASATDTERVLNSDDPSGSSWSLSFGYHLHIPPESPQKNGGVVSEKGEQRQTRTFTVEFDDVRSERANFARSPKEPLSTPTRTCRAAESPTTANGTPTADEGSRNKRNTLCVPHASGLMAIPEDMSTLLNKSLQCGEDLKTAVDSPCPYWHLYVKPAASSHSSLSKKEGLSSNSKEGVATAAMARTDGESAAATAFDLFLLCIHPCSWLASSAVRAADSEKYPNYARPITRGSAIDNTISATATRGGPPGLRMTANRGASLYEPVMTSVFRCTIRVSLSIASLSEGDAVPDTTFSQVKPSTRTSFRVRQPWGLEDVVHTFANGTKCLLSTGFMKPWVVATGRPRNIVTPSPSRTSSPALPPLTMGSSLTTSPLFSDKKAKKGEKEKSNAHHLNSVDVLKPPSLASAVASLAHIPAIKVKESRPLLKESVSAVEHIPNPRSKRLSTAPKDVRKSGPLELAHVHKRVADEDLGSEGNMDQSPVLVLSNTSASSEAQPVALNKKETEEANEEENLAGKSRDRRISHSTETRTGRIGPAFGGRAALLFPLASRGRSKAKSIPKRRSPSPTIARPEWTVERPEPNSYAWEPILNTNANSSSLGSRQPRHDERHRGDQSTAAASSGSAGPRKPFRSEASRVSAVFNVLDSRHVPIPAYSHMLMQMVVCGVWRVTQRIEVVKEVVPPGKRMQSPTKENEHPEHVKHHDEDPPSEQEEEQPTIPVRRSTYIKTSDQFVTVSITLLRQTGTATSQDDAGGGESLTPSRAMTPSTLSLALSGAKLDGRASMRRRTPEKNQSSGENNEEEEEMFGNTIQSLQGDEGAVAAPLSHHRGPFAIRTALTPLRGSRIAGEREREKLPFGEDKGLSQWSTPPPSRYRQVNNKARAGSHSITMPLVEGDACTPDAGGVTSSSASPIQRLAAPSPGGFIVGDTTIRALSEVALSLPRQTSTGRAPSSSHFMNTTIPKALRRSQRVIVVMNAIPSDIEEVLNKAIDTTIIPREVFHPIVKHSRSHHGLRREEEKRGEDGIRTERDEKEEEEEMRLVDNVIQQVATARELVLSATADKATQYFLYQKLAGSWQVNSGAKHSSGGGRASAHKPAHVLTTRFSSTTPTTSTSGEPLFLSVLKGLSEGASAKRHNLFPLKHQALPSAATLRSGVVSAVPRAVIEKYTHNDFSAVPPCVSTASARLQEQRTVSVRNDLSSSKPKPHPQTKGTYSFHNPAALKGLPTVLSAASTDYSDLLLGIHKETPYASSIVSKKSASYRHFNNNKDGEERPKPLTEVVAAGWIGWGGSDRGVVGRESSNSDKAPSDAYVVFRVESQIDKSRDSSFGADADRGQEKTPLVAYFVFACPTASLPSTLATPARRSGLKFFSTYVGYIPAVESSSVTLFHDSLKESEKTSLQSRYGLSGSSNALVCLTNDDQESLLQSHDSTVSQLCEGSIPYASVTFSSGGASGAISYTIPIPRVRTSSDESMPLRLGYVYSNSNDENGEAEGHGCDYSRAVNAPDLKVWATRGEIEGERRAAVASVHHSHLLSAMVTMAQDHPLIAEAAKRPQDDVAPAAIEHDATVTPHKIYHTEETVKRVRAMQGAVFVPSTSTVTHVNDGKQSPPPRAELRSTVRSPRQTDGSRSPSAIEEIARLRRAIVQEIMFCSTQELKFIREKEDLRRQIRQLVVFSVPSEADGEIVTMPAAALSSASSTSLSLSPSSQQQQQSPSLVIYTPTIRAKKELKGALAKYADIAERHEKLLAYRDELLRQIDVGLSRENRDGQHSEREQRAYVPQKEAHLAPSGANGRAAAASHRDATQPHQEGAEELWCGRTKKLQEALDSQRNELAQSVVSSMISEWLEAEDEQEKRREALANETVFEVILSVENSPR